ncbi:MAG: DUF3108 domain-containing protein [Rhizomicrobium sp.]
MWKAVFPLVALFVAATVLAEAAETLTQGQRAPASIGVAYRIAFWGIPFGATSYEGRFADGAYAASSHFETSGIVSLFWQATIDATASGRIGAGMLAPVRYDSFYRRGSSKNERVLVTYDAGRVATFADPPYDTNKYPVSEAQKREAVDPMSAITLVLAGVKADRANPCGTVAPVFDGRRRYDITFSFVRDEPAKVGNLFSGTAHLCRVHYTQIAGFKPKILKEGAAFPPIYGTFADIQAAGAPNGRYVVALKLWADLGWGTVTATLTRLQIPGVAAIIPVPQSGH